MSTLSIPRLRKAVFFVIAVGAFTIVGCGAGKGKPEIVWGERGVLDGEFIKPRAAAIDAYGRLYIVDYSARIQVYDTNGKYLGPTWTTPDWSGGRPSGLSIDREGNLLVSDSHYSCIRIYDRQGKELRVLGGQTGSKPGQFGYISDVVQDSDGHYYVSEFGPLTQRITKLDPDGTYLTSWGAPGTENGQFAQIRGLELGPDGLIYAADSCNHRIQVFTRDGKFVRTWGQPGTEPGSLRYPYDVTISPKPPHHVYVIEKGNNRVQKFTRDGEPLGIWGGPGREPGKLYAPWAIVVDPRGRVHVIDSGNNRVQRFRF